MSNFTITVNDREYSFKAFTLIDIYKADLCKGEFIKLMREVQKNKLSLSYPVIDTENVWFRNSKAFEICPTLLKNIEWLIDNKIGEEVKKETPLKAGMIFTACNDKHLYGVQEDLRVIIIRNDYNRSSEGGHFSDDIHNVEDFERAYSCTLKFK